METQTHPLLPRIEQYIIDNGIGYSRFGKALGNAALVTHLRSGKGLRPATEHKIEVFLQKTWKEHRASFIAERAANREALRELRNRKRARLLQEIDAFCQQHNVTRLEFCNAAKDRALVKKLTNGERSYDTAKERALVVFRDPSLLPIRRRDGANMNGQDEWERRNREAMAMGSTALLRRMVEVHWPHMLRREVSA